MAHCEDCGSDDEWPGDSGCCNRCGGLLVQEEGDPDYRVEGLS